MFLRSHHNHKWFASNHGGWAKQVYLGIKFKSGDAHILLIARYLREKGVVVEFLSKESTGGYRKQSAYAFCPELLQALNESGIHLPEN